MRRVLIIMRAGVAALLITALAGCGSITPAESIQSTASAWNHTRDTDAPESSEALPFADLDEPMDDGPIAKDDDTQADVVPSGSDAHLRARIVAQYPQLATGELSDWDATGLLREWAHEHVVWAMNADSLIEADTGISLYALDADAIFEMFDENRGGVWCGGAAYCLMQIYAAFGYEAYCLDMGFPGAATHVVTLVRIDDRGRSVLATQDAYFDLFYTDAIGRPLDVFDLIRSLLLRQEEDIHIGVGELPLSRAILLRPPDEPFVVEWRRSIVEFWGVIVPGLTELVSRGLPADVRYFFLYPIWARDTVGGTGPLAEIEEMLRHRRWIADDVVPPVGTAW